MLTEKDYEALTKFRVRAMGTRLREMVDDPAWDDVCFEDKVHELIAAEAAARGSRKIGRLVREARFKDPSACVEGVIYLPGRKPTRDAVARLATCRWVEDDEVLVVVAKSGGGKSYIAQALGNAACRALLPTRYVRLADMLDELHRARDAGDGSYYTAMDRLKSVKLLIIDDFLTTPIGTQDAVDLFEIAEARENRRATMVASQLEPNEWYLRIEGELVADSTLNRIATRARYLDVEGPNMREWLRDNAKPGA